MGEKNVEEAVAKIEEGESTIEYVEI